MGLGTGRSGTQTLVALLNQYPDAHITHEQFPIESTWLPNSRYFDRLCNYLDDRPETIVGDVSFYNLNYFYLFRERYNNIKFVCLKREKEATIQSYKRKTEGRNHFSFPNEAHEHRLWDKKFPMILNKDKDEALSFYYDHYYGQTAYLEHIYPDVIRTFDLSCLNTEEGLEGIFDFLKLKTEYIDDQFLNIKENTGFVTKTDFKPTKVNKHSFNSFKEYIKRLFR